MKGTKLANKFLDEIIIARTSEQILDVFYRTDGIDMAYQKELITWEQHQRLLGVINKLVKLM